MPQSRKPFHIILPSPARAPELIIEADPTDEIREVWEEVHTFLWIGGGIFLPVCSLLYVVLRRGLQPLAELLTAFERLTNDGFTARVSEHTVPELSRIHYDFNRMAEVLGATVQHNCWLTAHLVSLQEEEERRRGLGLMGLSERIHALGGRLTVTPRERGGSVSVRGCL